MKVYVKHLSQHRTPNHRYGSFLIAFKQILKILLLKLNSHTDNSLKEKKEFVSTDTKHTHVV